MVIINIRVYIFYGYQTAHVFYMIALGIFREISINTYIYGFIMNALIYNR